MDDMISFSLKGKTYIIQKLTLYLPRTGVKTPLFRPQSMDRALGQVYTQLQLSQNQTNLGLSVSFALQELYEQTTMEFGVRIVGRKNLNWCTPFFYVSL